ncbi:MAG: hypothetical protein MUO34_13245, partial [Ignavibacteriaceae bacterium]|nr:hypothetical protein [Ignavibacteriaceae bacterium]
MLRRIVTIFVVILLLPVYVSAQEHSILTPDGKIVKHKGNLKTLEIRSAKKNTSLNPILIERFSSSPSSPSSILNTIDTLTIPDGPWESNAFVGYGQDVLLQWFVAPADLYINQVGFAGFNNEPETYNLNVEVKIVRVNWPLDSLLNAPVARRGYYEAIGNGFDNEITAFMDNPDVTSGWVSVDGSAEPFGNDLWSDAGIGYPVGEDWGTTIINQTSPYIYQWVDLTAFGPPTVLQGEIFGIAIKNTYTDVYDTDFGVSYYFGDMDIGAWKYYADFRIAAGDQGWWTREYSWDFVAEVEMFSDRAPVVESYTQLASGIDVGPFTVDAVITDDNPSGGTAGVASASLYWSIDGTTWHGVDMAGAAPDFTCDIPAQAPGSTVSYYIEATDVNDNSNLPQTTSFYIFNPVYNTLVVFNGYTVVTGYPRVYYFGSGDWPASYSFFLFEHDKWAYGALTAELVDLYDNIIEICTNGPADINSDVIRAWLEADGTRNYMLAGDEWLGAQTNWTNTTYAAGTFQFDILGINRDYNDINYGAAGDEALPSVVIPEQGSLLGGPLYDLYTSVSADSGWTAPMAYDPYWEIGITNWLDGVDFESDVEVDMMGTPISGPDQVIGGHRVLPAGNKIAFFAFDPLSISSDTETEAEYYWYGFSD